MKDTYQHFISVLLLTPHGWHYLLPSAVWLLAFFTLWRKWPSMRSLIAKKRSELKALGELPSEMKWNGLKKLCAGISGGARKHTRTAINVAAGLLIGAAIASPLAYRAGRHSVQSDADAAKMVERLKYAKEFEAWKQRSIQWQKDLAAWKADQKGELNEQPISYAGRTAPAAP